MILIRQTRPQSLWLYPFFDAFWLVKKTIINANYRVFYWIFDQSARSKNSSNQSLSFIGADQEKRRL